MRHLDLQLTLSALLAAASVSLAFTRRVPQDYPTIQSALNAVQADDTVLVSLDTYPEALVAPPVPFVLKGDVLPDTGDYPRPIIDPSPLSGSDSLACLVALSSTPQIYEDLRFRNGAAMYPRNGVAIGGVHSANERLFRNCVFDSTFRGLQSDTGMVTLDHCWFVDNQCHAVHSLFGHLAATDCYFSGVTTAAYVPLVQTGLQGATFERCAFGPSYPAETFASYGPCDLLDCLFDSCGGPAQIFVMIELDLFSGRIEHNVFSRNLLNSFIINSETACDDTVIFRDNLVIDNRAFNGSTAVDFHAPNNDSLNPPDCMYVGIVEGNIFRDNVAQDPGVKALHTDPITTVTNNRFEGLYPRDRNCIGFYWSGTDLHGNHFEAGDFAIWTQDTVQNSDARWNWWGDSTGPYNTTRNPDGQGAELRGGSLFDPWCPDTNCFESAPEHPDLLAPSSFLLSAYPNPFNSVLHLTLIPSEIGIVKVELFDILGRKASEIWHGPLAIRKEINFDASALASGIYFARVTDVISRKNLAMTKLVLLK